MEQKKKQSKCSEIPFREFRIQEYVISHKLSSHQKKLLFQMRTSTFPVFMNIKFLVNDTKCPCCSLEEDTMSHQIECPVINKSTKCLSKISISIHQIFSSDVNKQVEVTLVFEEATMQRKKLLNKKQ